MHPVQASPGEKAKFVPATCRSKRAPKSVVSYARMSPLKNSCRYVNSGMLYPRKDGLPEQLGPSNVSKERGYSGWIEGSSMSRGRWV